jgi:hypothetical protein
MVGFPQSIDGPLQTCGGRHGEWGEMLGDMRGILRVKMQSKLLARIPFEPNCST